METVGMRIRKRRKELGISADELAEAIGKDRTTIFRYEKGAIEKMPIDILKPIAKALRTTPAALMGWEDTPEETTDSCTVKITESEDGNSNPWIFNFAPEVQEDIYAFGRAANEMSEEEREEMMNFLKRMYKEHF